MKNLKPEGRPRRHHFIISAQLLLGLSLFGGAVYLRTAHEANAQNTGGSPASSTPAFTCVTSDSSDAANSLCVSIVIGQGAETLGSSGFGTNPLNIAKGATVIWWNNDTVPHTITADNGSFNSGVLSPGQYFSHSFNTPGTFSYHSAVQGQQSMSGTIIVSQNMAIALSCPMPSMSPSPSPSPSASPSVSPTMSPTTSPTASPSVSPTESPSATPTSSPSATESPSGVPTV